jgi:hypothetical protein
MSNPFELGILYTEHSRLKAGTPVASLWSYETSSRGDDRRSVTVNSEGSHEYWLTRSDPLLNTILPGTSISLIVNFGDPWAAGRSLATAELLPRLCVVGPVTQGRILRVGQCVRAVGSAFISPLTPAIFWCASLTPRRSNRPARRRLDSRRGRTTARIAPTARDTLLRRGAEGRRARAARTMESPSGNRTFGMSIHRPHCRPCQRRPHGTEPRPESATLCAAVLYGCGASAKAVCAYYPLSSPRAGAAVYGRVALGLAVLGGGFLRPGTHDQRVPRLCRFAADGSSFNRTARTLMSRTFDSAAGPVTGCGPIRPGEYAFVGVSRPAICDWRRLLAQ